MLGFESSCPGVSRGNFWIFGKSVCKAGSGSFTLNGHERETNNETTTSRSRDGGLCKVSGGVGEATRFSICLQLHQPI
jgi:hypothetical protein